MPCRHCGQVGPDECNLCYRFKNGMSSRKYYRICARIASLYPVKRKRKVFRFPRVIGHPLCKGKCVAKNPRYSDLKIQRIKGVITEEDFFTIIEKPCIFCGVVPSNGVDRCDSKYTYLIDNVQPCCFQCNIIKKNVDTEDFIDKINDVYAEQYM